MPPTALHRVYQRSSRQSIRDSPPKPTTQISRTLSAEAVFTDIGGELKLSSDVEVLMSRDTSSAFYTEDLYWCSSSVLPRPNNAKGHLYPQHFVYSYVKPARRCVCCLNPRVNSKILRSKFFLFASMIGVHTRIRVTFWDSDSKRYVLRVIVLRAFVKSRSGVVFLELVFP